MSDKDRLTILTDMLNEHVTGTTNPPPLDIPAPHTPSAPPAVSEVFPPPPPPDPPAPSKVS